MARPEYGQWSEEPLSQPLQSEGDGPEPEQPRPRKGKLRRLFRTTPVMMFFAALLLAAVGTLSWYATEWKQQVKVSRVVVSGTALIPLSSIERRLKSFKGKNLDEVGTDDVRRALAPELYIRKMRIGKELNGILRVSIEERRPAALFESKGQKLIIDTEGNLLPDDKVTGRYRLVQVYGAGVEYPARAGGLRRIKTGDRTLLFALLDALDKSNYARLMVNAIHLERDDRTWFAVTGSPIRFVVGNDGNFKEKLKKFEIFWQKVVAKKGIDSYESVDLRFRERVFATTPETEAPPADSSAAPVEPAKGGQLPDERIEPITPHAEE